MPITGLRPLVHPQLQWPPLSRAGQRFTAVRISPARLLAWSIPRSRGLRFPGRTPPTVPPARKTTQDRRRGRGGARPGLLQKTPVLYSPSCRECGFSETWRGRGLFRLIRDTCKLDATMAQAASSPIPNRSATSLIVRGNSMLSDSPPSRQWGESCLGVLCSRRGGLCSNVLSM